MAIYRFFGCTKRKKKYMDMLADEQISKADYDEIIKHNNPIFKHRKKAMFSTHCLCLNKRFVKKCHA